MRRRVRTVSELLREVNDLLREGFAGIWVHWLGADGSELETMAILTAPANAEMTGIHDRMPLVLDPEYYDLWLDCRSGSAVGLSDVLRSSSDGSYPSGSGWTHSHWMADSA